MEILKQILQKRGVKGKLAVEKFLNPPPPQTVSPKDLGLKLIDLKKATTRIQKAVENNEPIFIHGDYDVDGICATAILWEAIYFDLSYQNVHPFIPHRINHGYGLSRQSIEEIQRQRTAILSCYDDTNHSNKNDQRSLLITLDCGITAFEEVNSANSLGFDVIILDHHEAIAETPARSDLPSPRLGGARLRVEGRTFPNAFAILHSNIVCSTALAWFLTQVLQGHTESRCKDLDLVALATIADLEPLTGLNRSFTKYGLEELNHTERIGLQELIKIAGIENRKISTYEVGWMLGPRLNAMGRLENALDSLRLLCTRDRERARELAQKLNEANYQRQEMTKKAVEQARKMVLTYNLEPITCNLLILSHSEWHEGIIGLIASKMTEEFGRPTLAISIGETVSKGSARSIKGFNLVENLRLHQDLLINVGGHPMAAGLTIETAKIAEFSGRFTDPTKRSDLPFGLRVEGRTSQETGATSPDDHKWKKNLDLELSLKDINFDLFQQLQQLEPFGLGNPQPLFQTNDLIINDLRLVGKENQHLKLKVGDDKNNLLDAIGFSLGFRANELKIGNKVNLIYYLEKDNFNGSQKVQLRVKTIEKTN